MTGVGWGDLQVEVEHEDDDHEPDGQAHDTAVAIGQFVLQGALIFKRFLHVFQGRLGVRLGIDNVVVNADKCLALLIH